MSLPPPDADSDRQLPPPAPIASSLPRPVSGRPTPAPGWPIAPPAGATPPPPGYVAYDTNSARAELRSTAGLRKTTVGLFWAAVVATAAQAGAFFSRVSVWDDVVDGSAGLRELDEADGLVVLASLARIGLTVAAAIVLAVWSYRTVRNAQRLGMSSLQPKLAAWGWFIPFGNLSIPFSRLRRTVESLGGSGSRISQWQVAWIVFFTLSWYASVSFNYSNFDGRDAVRTALSDEAVFSIFVAITMAAAAVLAQRALRQADETIANNLSV